jgi:hypothetical protein
MWIYQLFGLKVNGELRYRLFRLKVYGIWSYELFGLKIHGVWKYALFGLKVNDKEPISLQEADGLSNEWATFRERKRVNAK